ncbi:L,D-transpeptidase family protein [Sulfurovum sp. zt1-1]|uniref:L,D-transpeptidase family protein n=1 Tax=Sulfurovum zhangzhouensis TaxID=3019067 RepID=A0ABT7QWB9_9BACT|nr:L,D-transpeptidase family protein [Sulfurovum zhangzhouensis]MDM5271087.1 L,D-transpeptidase family protein [Sulfurovum zhangzhouensis]
MKTIILWSLLFLSTYIYAGNKLIFVDLDEQLAYAYEDDELLFKGAISSGVQEHSTPTGTFKVLEKKISHKSNLWPKPNGGAKMHYMLRLTYDGIAMHLGTVGKYPLSHGCIRMKNGFAQKLWTWTDVGTTVQVMGYPPYKNDEPGIEIVYDDTYSIDP